MFESSTGDVDIQKKHINGNGVWVVSAGFANNGILGKTDVKARIFNEGTVTMDMFGNTFYRNFKYKMVTHARVFSMKPRHNISDNQGLFLSTVLRKLTYVFEYNQMCTWEQIKNKTILLPADADGDPDWMFMENYMSAIQNRILTSPLLRFPKALPGGGGRVAAGERCREQPCLWPPS